MHIHEGERGSPSSEGRDDMTTFNNMAEAEAYVIEAIQTEHLADFDTDAIARDATDWRDGRLTLIAEDDEFWAIVASHDIS